MIDRATYVVRRKRVMKQASQSAFHAVSSSSSPPAIFSFFKRFLSSEKTRFTSTG